MRRLGGLLAVVALGLAGPAGAMVCGVKVVSDSRPDFADMESLITSATGKYQTTDEQCKAMWRWLARCRRQTPEAVLRGTPVRDPIMFYNDFGYSLCSDYASLNCGIWREMGLPVRLWDITAHTVSECYYDGGWHMFDNSLSAYYTLCDGKTVAGVEEVGKKGACAASGGREEMGHAARYHCAAATSPNGFLSGCDTQRSLQEEGEYVFNPNRLKLRYYYHGFELGHRYTLNLRENEVYTRYAKPLRDAPDYYLPLPDGSSPQGLGSFGNGEWVWKPDLKSEQTRRDLWEGQQVRFTAEGLQANGKDDAFATFRVNAAHLVTSARVFVELELTQPEDRVTLTLLDPDTGHKVAESWQVEGKERGREVREMLDFPELAGAHSFLVQLAFQGKPIVRELEIRTITQLNALTLPLLTLGKNTIDVVTGQGLDTVAVWPELRNGQFAQTCVESENVASGEACDWHGCLWLEQPGTGYLTYAVETPTPMVELT